MSKKSPKIAALIERCHGRGWPPHYLGYFECFNTGLYYEAHDVLEELWLPVRHEADGKFYQGLIQLAGAFVHLQKDRLQPAMALFQKARLNLSRYPPVHKGLDLGAVLALIDHWDSALSKGSANPLTPQNVPKLELPLGTKEEGG